MGTGLSQNWLLPGEGGGRVGAQLWRALGIRRPFTFKPQIHTVPGQKCVSVPLILNLIHPSLAVLPEARTVNLSEFPSVSRGEKTSFTVARRSGA